ncbi:hypothetical protein BJ165DRAFT_1493856 [Panaeolus papilionaceus]|nr:hypothetical protein BJ165DRAFT_1493802 [Panaeolus papilionaceus]KAF9039762.1 hypothetical protein BJ165DRAFT_1493856 [Panaeolus papilionaceus]
MVDVKEEEEINSNWSRQATDAITHIPSPTVTHSSQASVMPAPSMIMIISL